MEEGICSPGNLLSAGDVKSETDLQAVPDRDIVELKVDLLGYRGLGTITNVPDPLASEFVPL